jgi:hypothetical protein
MGSRHFICTSRGATRISQKKFKEFFLCELAVLAEWSDQVVILATAFVDNDHFGRPTLTYLEAAEYRVDRTGKLDRSDYASRISQIARPVRKSDGTYQRATRTVPIPTAALDSILQQLQDETQPSL